MSARSALATGTMAGRTIARVEARATGEFISLTTYTANAVDVSCWCSPARATFSFATRIGWRN